MYKNCLGQIHSAQRLKKSPNFKHISGREVCTISTSKTEINIFAENNFFFVKNDFTNFFKDFRALYDRT